MSSKNLFVVFFLSFFLAGTSVSFAQPTGRSIMQKVSDQSKKYKTQKADVKMVIKDKSGSTRERYFNLINKTNKREDRSLMRFFKPTDVKGSSFLSVRTEKTGNTDQRMYFPALGSVNQIKSSQKTDSFMGSDFSYEDIGGRSVSKDKHVLTKQDSNAYVITSTPKKMDGQYGKYVYQINKAMMLPTTIIFYDKHGKAIKRLKNDKVQKIKGSYVVTHSVMERLDGSSTTELNKTHIKIGMPISNSEVGIQGLKS